MNDREREATRQLATPPAKTADGDTRATENGETEEHVGVGRPLESADAATPVQPVDATASKTGPRPWRPGADTGSSAPVSPTTSNQPGPSGPPGQPGQSVRTPQAGRSNQANQPNQANQAGRPAQLGPSGQGGQSGRTGQPAQPGPSGQTGQGGQSDQNAQGGQAGRAAQPGQGGQPGRSAPAYWAQGPAEPPPQSPTARRRGGDSPLSYRQADPPGRATNQPTDLDDPISEEARRPVPKYGVKGALYKLTRLNLGPSRRDAEEREIRDRLNRQTRRTRGYCGYIGIASEKGGVGKTTLASLLAAEIAEGRRESVGIADLNPDLGTLPDRFGVRPHYSIRDLLAHVDEIPWRYHVHDFMEKVPEMNVRVLAASTDRKIRHQLSVADVELLAELFAPFFSFAILDNGTHITHEAMLGTLRTAHGMVLVTDNTRDGANLARKTLQFLTDNGYPDMRRRVVLAVVAKETASPIKTRAIDKAFRDHVRDLVVVPYDPALDGGGKIPFRDPNAVNKLLRKDTRAAVRRLAAVVMDDLVS